MDSIKITFSIIFSFMLGAGFMYLFLLSEVVGLTYRLDQCYKNNKMNEYVKQYVNSAKKVKQEIRF